MARTKRDKPVQGKSKVVEQPGCTGAQEASGHQRHESKKVSELEIEPSRCYLLDRLSAELRNQIWRNVLVSDSCIFVDVREPHQPALLRVNQQIRSEATSTYYHDNVFLLPMEGYDSTPGLKWCNVARPYLLGEALFNVDWAYFTRSGATWEKFTLWLRRARDGLVPRYTWKGDSESDDEDEDDMWDSGDEFLEVTALFDLMEELKGLPWATVYREILKLKNEIELEEAPEFGLFDDPGSDC